jgi:hydroxymethylbilane synthase
VTRETLRVGTRPSALALAQSGLVAARLRAAGHPAELVTVSTHGDRSSAPIPTLGVGVFVSQLRDALAAGEVDIAVHSYKDLPTAPDPRLTLAAIPPREDPRDALVARDGLVLGELPTGATVGTGSPRRTAQLEALGLGLRVVPIRGNVDTRLAKVASAELDAVVVASAGLRRLGRVDEATELLDPLQMLPAPAQGALAVECRADRPELAALLAQVLDDAWTRAAVTAERAVLATLEAGCSAPVGALADVVSDLTDDGRAVDRVSLRAVVGTAAGALLRASATGDLDDAEKLGAALAAELLDMGGGALDAARGTPLPQNVSSGVHR